MHSEEQKTVRRRLSPAEQIQSAKAALQRAQARQRQHDTRGKIVLGGYVLAWIRSDVDAAQKLLQRLNSVPPREQDREALAVVRDELRSILRNNNDANNNRGA
ncbi:hypothetical protein [Alcaligenes faecalis]|uniref:Mobilization protein n=1 Tax=Alcaligenes faecalis TaxID=511 RepID=A0ABY7N9C1_ALCFA|nr:hypothetical protein [Alcaligenes faecalis]WBM39993.1 hypothetical protein M2J83_09335 [Alcaligenes faecalis]